MMLDVSRLALLVALVLGNTLAFCPSTYGATWGCSVGPSKPHIESEYDWIENIET